MKIYHDGLEWTSIPTTRNRPGSFVDRLVGINISRNRQQTLVEPIYQAVLKFETINGWPVVTLAWDKPICVIVLMNQWPFINIIKPQGYQLED